MPRVEVPITAEDESLRSLSPKVWYWKRKFMVKETRKDKDGNDFFVYYVFNKWDHQSGGSDLCWLSPSIKSIRELFEIMNEELPHELVSELEA